MSTPLHNAIDQIRTPGGIAGYIHTEVRILEYERDDAKQCARWMLCFLVNEPQHLAEARRRWPWLETMEAVQ